MKTSHLSSVTVVARQLVCELCHCSQRVRVIRRRLSSSRPHQRSVSDMVHGVEGPAAVADGGLIQCVAVGLTVAVVDRQVLHVHRSL